MEILDKNTEDVHNQQVIVQHSEIILNELITLSTHSKLVLCACISLLSKNNNAKITVMDVFTKYKKVATKFNVSWVSLSRVIEHIKELEMLGFLKCKYPPKGRREIKYIQIFEPAEIPKYITILKEDLGREKL